MFSIKRCLSFHFPISSVGGVSPSRVPFVTFDVFVKWQVRILAFYLVSLRIFK